jgi:hypothetical protein
LARQGLSPDQHPIVVNQAALKRIMGLALLRSGNKSAGSQDCEEACSLLEAAGDPVALLAARLAALESRVETGQSSNALALFHQIEDSLKNYPESCFRALALISRVEPQDFDRARQALAALERLWPAELYHSYLERPDINRLARPLLSQPNASKK